MPTEIGKAYVQIIPSARGIKGSITKILKPESSSAGEDSGASLGRNLLGTFTKLAIGAKVGQALASGIKSSVLEGGKLEQSIGGINTLFKGSADIVKGYAKNAYRDAQISSNQYMEQVTSFSASLLQSLGGDTQKAAKSADMAIKDMADNSAKMGTNISSIQDAYQGFAKQNYTMLDNLKLGYGGTKTEMERLLADAEKITGVKYDINDLNDVFNAIHAIQGELKISGVAADEAKTTLSGSFAAMKASAQDFVGNLALGENIGPSLMNLATTTNTFLTGNLLPMIGNIFKQIPNIASEGFNLLAEKFTIFKKLGELLSPAMEKFKSAFDGLVEKMQPFIDAVGNVLKPILEGVALVIGKVLSEGITILSNAFNGLGLVIQVLTPLFNFLGDVFNKILGFVEPIIFKLTEFTTHLLDNKTIMEALGQTFNVIWTAIQSLMTVVWEVIGVVIRDIKNWFNSMGVDGNTLKSIMDLVWQGIMQAISFAKDIIAGAIGIIANVFTFLGNHSGVLKTILLTVWSVIKTAIKIAAGIIVGVVKTIVAIFNGLKTAGNILLGALRGAWNGIVSAISGAKARISGIINNIKSIFNSLRNINLFSAGKAIIDGFLRGLKHAFGAVKNFVGGIAGWIKSHKGPISYDRKLLIPAGNAIIGGLNKSMIESFKDVKSNVLSMAGEIYDGFDIKVKPLNLSPDISNLDKNILDNKLNSNLNFNAYSEYKANRDSKVESMLLNILSLLKILSEKDDDVYIDGEKVSVMLGRKIDEYKKKKDLYENRRMGVVL
ncbi:phage tail protein [Anaerococcus obesiensis]|uniref:phage tail protein n=1 Tax=Anaerococcus obesiensis TaxID=1287640 RepID=UPI0039955836